MKPFFKKERIDFRKKFLAVLLTAWLLLVLTGCSRNGAESYQRIDTAMGTVIKETIYVEKGGEDITGRIRDRIVELEEQVLSHRKDISEIARLNSHAGDSMGVQLSRELWDILCQVQEVSAKSGGALDITVGQTVGMWNIDSLASNPETSVTLPSAAQIEASLEAAGYDKLRLEENKIYLPEGMRLDLGAVGKGIACDEILGYLQEQPMVSGAVISIGGSILTYGEKPDGSSWNIGIVDPDDPSAYIGGLTLDGQWCVSTSGDYERYVEIDGIRYHHIIDPATGYPADAGLGSVTVLSRSGVLSDALSTACFVLGVEESLPLLEAYDAFAVFVDHQGQVKVSSGMDAYFQPLS